MPTLVVVGAQWGDEAKGKIVDVLSDRASVVVRYGGGNNAGHTIITGGETFKLHLLPAGILHRHVTSVLGGGMAVCPKSLLSELAAVRSRVAEPGRLVVSHAAHVVMPYHRRLDELEEAARGDKKIGTTSRGIGPCYTDKVQRIGIRMGEIVDARVLKERLESVLVFKNRMIELLGGEPFEFGALYDEYREYGEQLVDFVGETESLVQDAVAGSGNVMFEGAQGTFLDLDEGTYPYVTSSHPISAGACIGTGIGPRDIDSVLGVCKAYATRVGEGPFPTELTDATGDQIREQGQEYGTTTGRPRRCGWLDAFALRHSCRVNSLSGLVLTRIDVLSGVGAVKVGVGYQVGGQELGRMPVSIGEWESAEPVWTEFEGWDGDLRGCRSWEDLPGSVQTYVRGIEELTGTPAAILSIGPDRDETIILRPDLLFR